MPANSWSFDLCPHCHLIQTCLGYYLTHRMCVRLPLESGKGPSRTTYVRRYCKTKDNTKRRLFSCPTAPIYGSINVYLVYILFFFILIIVFICMTCKRSACLCSWQNAVVEEKKLLSEEVKISLITLSFCNTTMYVYTLGAGSKVEYYLKFDVKWTSFDVHRTERGSMMALVRYMILYVFYILLKIFFISQCSGILKLNTVAQMRHA